MAKLLKISEAATMALHSMVLLARDPDRMLTTQEMADEIHVSANHLAKVMQRLSKDGLASATRGPHGGFMLGKRPSSINLLSIYEAIEGPLEKSNCLLEVPVCGGTHCILGGLIAGLHQQVRDYLKKTRLSDLDDVYPCQRRVS